MIAFPESVPVLKGDHILLREMTEADVPAWFKRASDPESSSLSGDPIPESIDVIYGWLETNRQFFRDGTGLRWAIVPAAAEGSVGSIGFSKIDAADRTAELGAVIARAYWSQGIVTAAARRVIDYAFNELGLKEIRADLVQRNEASKRVLEKLGFEYVEEIPAYCETPEFGAEAGYLYRLVNPLAKD